MSKIDVDDWVFFLRYVLRDGRLERIMPNDAPEWAKSAYEKERESHQVENLRKLRIE